MGNKKILVVDDNEDVLTTMKNILEREGYEVTFTPDPKKAIELSKKNAYDLIILDIMMPLSGEEVADIMKKSAMGTPKIIFCTIVPKNDVKMFGIDGFIQKPLDYKIFVKEIKRVLET